MLIEFSFNLSEFHCVMIPSGSYVSWEFVVSAFARKTASFKLFLTGKEPRKQEPNPRCAVFPYCPTETALRGDFGEKREWNRST